jgi:hypothetical protein
MKHHGLATLACALSIGITAAPSAAAEKMAVLILGTSEKDQDLADNVTEMVIAAVAKRGGIEIAGKEEFRARLGLDTERRGQSCLDDTVCVAKTAVSLGVRRLVTGSVGSRGKQFLFSLNLHDVEAGRVDAKVFRLIEGGVDDLIKAVEVGTAELFKPKVEPGRVQVSSVPEGARVSIDNAYLGVTPLISGTLLPGSHKVRVEAEGRFPWISTVDVSPGQELGVNLTEANLPRRRRWPTATAITSGALGVAGLATGGLLGVLSQVKPTGDTRADAQDDLEQKGRLARGANAAFIAGGALLVVSVAILLGYGDDVFGRAE